MYLPCVRRLVGDCKDIVLNIIRFSTGAYYVIKFHILCGGAETTRLQVYSVLFMVFNVL